MNNSFIKSFTRSHSLTHTAHSHSLTLTAHLLPPFVAQLRLAEEGCADGGTDGGTVVPTGTPAAALLTVTQPEGLSYFSSAVRHCWS